jgi:hypothetical protein
LRIFIQEDRDRAIASGLMKNLSLVLLKQKKKVKKAPKPKKKKTISNFFHLDKFQQKREESKGFPAKTKKNG